MRLINSLCPCHRASAHPWQALARRTFIAAIRARCPSFRRALAQSCDGILEWATNANMVFCQLVPWQFDSAGNYGFKRTYRRIAFLLTRLLTNLGARSETPLLTRWPTPVTQNEARRGLNGLYLDQPGSGMMRTSSFGGAPCRHRLPNRVSNLQRRVGTRFRLPAGLFSQRIHAGGIHPASQPWRSRHTVSHRDHAPLSNHPNRARHRQP